LIPIKNYQNYIKIGKPDDLAALVKNRFWDKSFETIRNYQNASGTASKM
jgi:hypothetical protein